MQESRYGQTDIKSEYLIYPFQSPIQYNVNYTGSFSKYSIVDRYYANSLVKPVKRLYYGGAEWSDVGAISLTFSLTDLAYTFGDHIIHKTASSPNISVAVSHPTQDRIDAIVINEEGEIRIKKGTPAVDPKRPSISEDEVLIQYALVKKATHPAANKIGTREIVYEKSGSSWTPSSYQISGSISGSVNFASTLDPYILDSCVAANTDYRTGLNFFKTIGTINRVDYTSLSMRLRLNQELESDRYLSISIYGTSSFVAGTASSSTINLMPYGIDSKLIGEWQHIVVPTIKFGGKVEAIKGIKFRMIGGASASNTPWDLDYILFQTGVDYDEYMDASNSSYTTSTSLSTSTTGGGGVSGGGSFSLTIEDYLTGGSFTDIEKIIFRGNTVVVNTLPSPNGLTATGVTVTQDTPREVVVWIPAPNYVNPLSPSINNSGYLRYVSQPSNNSYLETSSPGNFGVGSWTPYADFQANGTSVGNTRLTKTGAFTPFSQSSPFSVSSNATSTVKFEIFKEDETTAIRTITKTIDATTQNITHSLDDFGKSGASLTFGVLSTDQDKFKLASLSTAISTSTVITNGGRFKCRLTYNNGVDGTLVFNTSTFMYDSDGINTSATVGAVDFDEKTPSIRRFSGIAYYGPGSTFALTASNIDLLNEITFPTTKQIDFVAYNLAITNEVAPNTGVNSLNGHADGTKSGVGAALTGWSIDYDNNGLTFSRTATINDVMLNDGTNTNFNGISGIYIPGFSPHSTNTLNAGKVSYVAVRLFDYGSPDVTLNSYTRKTLIDTDVPNSVTNVSKPIDSEIGRLSFSGVFTNGSSSFQSSLMLSDPTNIGELQYIFGRMIYPQHDFSTYMPYFNFTSGSNYSALSGVSQNYNAITVAGLNGSAATTVASLSVYRWYVSAFSKSDSSAFTGGSFRFECNWLESDLHCPNGVSSASGNEDLAILIGFDSSGANLVPDKFLFVSGNTGIYGGRTLGSTNQLTGVGTNNNISFSKGTIAAPMTKCWLFVGYKETARGKQLILSDVLFTGN